MPWQRFADAELAIAGPEDITLEPAAISALAAKQELGATVTPPDAVFDRATPEQRHS